MSAVQCKVVDAFFANRPERGWRYGAAEVGEYVYANMKTHCNEALSLLPAEQLLSGDCDAAKTALRWLTGNNEMNAIVVFNCERNLFSSFPSVHYTGCDA